MGKNGCYGNTLTFNGSSGATLAMNAGKVGIGVTAPTTQLQIAGSFSANYSTPNSCGCVVSGVSDVPVTTSHFSMFNANFTNTATLPSGATEGQTMIMSSGATLSYTISTTNTTLSSALTVTTGQAYQFVFVNGSWSRLL